MTSRTIHDVSQDAANHGGVSGEMIGHFPVSEIVGNGFNWSHSPKNRVTKLTRSHSLEQLTSDLIDLCSDQISKLLVLTDSSSHYSVQLDLVEYQSWNPKLSHLILFYPQAMFPLLDEALRKAQLVHRNNLSQRQTCIKPNCHVRIHNKFEASEISSALVPRSDAVGKLIFFKGTVIRTGMLKMLETSRTYICTTCDKQFSVDYEIEQYNAIPRPTRCLATRRAGAKPCKGSRFEEASATQENGALAEPFSANCKDYQEIKVQEQTTRMDIGSIPRSITIILHDDLVDICKAGDDISVTGVVIRRWRSVATSQRCEVELVILANNIHVHSQQKGGIILDDATKEEFELFWNDNRKYGLRARDAILRNFCPDIVGMYWVKLAVMLILVGGVSKYQDGLKMRGDGHMLLVGDPGTGKSQFLKYASRLVPRTVYTTGIGSTNAGLTVTAVKDSGEWQLEAGALVLADRGLCCIDEFGSIRENDKTAIHEAMEQQTISVAKAGLVCKLNTRCSILAATNPKGKYDPNRDIEVNVALASPLLSRFDIIMVLLDNQNNDWDQEVSSHILAEEIRENTSMQSDESSLPEDTIGPLQQDNGRLNLKRRWTLHQLSLYIAFVKTECTPALTESANRVLTQYYQLQRTMDTRNAARTTIRMLESLVRLAQAHAKLMFQAEVTVRDAVVAVLVMESSMRSCGLDGVPSALHERFPDNPNDLYNRKEQVILSKLDLENLVCPFDDPLPCPSPRPESATARPVADASVAAYNNDDTRSRSATPVSSWKSSHAASSSRFIGFLDEPSGRGNDNLFLNMSLDDPNSSGLHEEPVPVMQPSVPVIQSPAPINQAFDQHSQYANEVRDGEDVMLDDVIDFGDDELLGLEADFPDDDLFGNDISEHQPNTDNFVFAEPSIPMTQQIPPQKIHQMTPQVQASQRTAAFTPLTGRSVTNDEILLDLFGDGDQENDDPSIDSTPLQSKRMGHSSKFKLEDDFDINEDGFW